jgi:hypothetical protein
VTIHCYAPVVKKDANTYFTRKWDWTIDKWANTTELWLKEGETGEVIYWVKLMAVAKDYDYGVKGTIYITNPHPTEAMELTSVTDMVSPDIAADVHCNTWTVPAAGEIECTYQAVLPDPQLRENTATVVFNKINFYGYADVDFENAKVTLIDQCVDVSDTMFGDLGQVCADKLVFEYTFPAMPKTIGPYAECGEYEVNNCAKFVTVDTKTTDKDCWAVKIIIPCNQGCTPGYWKNHEEAWKTYKPGDLIGDVFETDHCGLGKYTLMEGLSFAGGSDIEGKAEILLRAGIAALLNASHPDVGYPWGTSKIISEVNAALASHDEMVMVDLAAQLDKMNNLGCPLN